MPLALTSLRSPKVFAPAPAAHPLDRLATLSSPPSAALSVRNQTRSPSRAPDPLSPFVLVKRRHELRHACAGVTMRCRDSLKALSSSVLVKQVLGRSVFLVGVSASRVTPSCVPWTRAIGPHVEGHCGAPRDTEGRILGCREAVAWMPCKPRQLVLVKSFSSLCPAPLLQRRLPGVGLALNGWGVCRA